MAHCTACGTIFHEDDNHICDSAKVPNRGKEIRKGEKIIVDNPDSELNK